VLRDRLLRLYPRPWRERYGREFLATVEPGALSVQQVIDIVSGAIDARLSSDVRRAIAASRVAPSGGGSMISKSLTICDRRQARYTTRDGFVGAGVMLGATILVTVLGVFAKRAGWTTTGEILVSLSFPVSLTISMPFWVMKGQPWKAQVVMVGGTLVFLIAIGYVATLI
jgi:hypothetical protein